MMRSDDAYLAPAINKITITTINAQPQRPMPFSEVDGAGGGRGVLERRGLIVPGLTECTEVRLAGTGAGLDTLGCFKLWRI